MATLAVPLRRLAWSLGLLTLFAPRIAGADRGAATDAPGSDSSSASTTPTASDTSSAGSRVVATGVAVVPGAVLHGLGHVAKGDPKTGATLMLVEAGGLVGIGGGLGILLATGASRKLVLPAAALTVAGAALFFTSYFADIYGSATSADQAGAARGFTPLMVTEAGYKYVYDPTFAYRSFFVDAVDLRLGRWRLRPEAWHALDDRNERLRGTVGYRLIGPLPRAAAGVATERAPADGTFVDVETALTHHAYVSDGFRVTTAEIQARGRWDLFRLSPSLRGSFVEGSAGLALGWYGYEFANGAVDANDLLLAGFAYGVYVGRADRVPSGEVSVFYDHRHDGFIAGMKLTGLGSGVPGHMGLRGLAYLTPSFGFRAELEAGSALSFGASILYRVDP